MRIRAKFYLQSIETTPNNQGGRVKLAAVTRGERNAEWSTWTPSGDLSMQVTNPAAFQFFVDLQTEVQGGVIKYPEVFLTIERAVADDLAGTGHAFEAGRHGNCTICGATEAAPLHAA